MKVFLRQIVCIITIFLLFVSTSHAVQMPDTLEYRDNIPGVFVSEFPGNRYDGSRPVLIFFPGSGTANSITNTVQYIIDSGIYTDLNIDLIVVAVNNGKHETCKSDWELLARGLINWLKNDIDPENKVNYIVDCISLGGLGGTLFIERALENNLNVLEITYADACTQQEVTQDLLMYFMRSNIKVNVFSGKGPGKISVKSKDILNALKDEKNFYGEELQIRHSAVLAEAISLGLHHEYSADYFSNDTCDETENDFPKHFIVLGHSY